MSWGLSYTNKANFIEDVPQFALPTYDEATQQAMRDQVTAAREAVKILLDSGAVGDETKEYSISIGGHANPGHGQAAGWSNDSIYVNIYQLSPPPAPAPEAPPTDAATTESA